MMYCNNELKLMVVEEVDKIEEDVVWVSKREYSTMWKTQK